MFTEFINSFLKLGIGKAFDPRFGDGRFTVLNKTQAHITTGTITTACALELSTDFQVTGQRYDVVNHDPKSYFFGYNKKYIDEDGVYDPLRAIDEYSRTVPGLRLSKEDLKALALTDNIVDSQESFMYNMLISWFKARLYVDMKGKDYKFSVKQSGYNDSHVGMAIQGQYTDIDVEVELGSPIDLDNTTLSYEPRTSENYWSKPYVLRYTNTNVGQVTFYLLHAAGRDVTSGLSADVPITGVDSAQVLLDPVGNLANTMLNVDEVKWDKPEILWKWIMDYVRLNRLEQAFAAALELLGAVSSTPMPSYQESLFWDKMVTVVNLAKFAPTRARVPSNLQGEPNVVDLNAINIVATETQAPSNFLVISAVFNYMTMMGIAGLTANYAEDCSNWRAAFSSMDAELQILNSVDARAAMVSLIVGKEMVSCFNPNCYVSYNLTALEDYVQTSVNVVHEPGYDPIVKFDCVPQYVSGSLLLGVVSCDFACFDHLKAYQTVSVDKSGVMDRMDAVKLATAYRLFGHDVQLENVFSGELYDTFANVRDSTVAAFSIMGKSRYFDKIRVTDSVQREGRSTALPNTISLFNYGIVKIEYMAPSLTVTAYRNRRHVHQPNVMISSARKTVTFKVNNMSEFRTVQVKARTRDGIRVQGFHPAVMDPAPAFPQTTGVVAPTTTNEVEVHEQPVVAAE